MIFLHRYFLFFCAAAAAVLCWDKPWVLKQAQAGGRRGGKNPSSAQYKVSRLLPQLNLQMNSMHYPSHRAERRVS